MFCVSNGVKQGGVLSPGLVNVYLDAVSCALNRFNIRWRIKGHIVNHLSYADNYCLICLPSAGMQKLLNASKFYATEHRWRLCNANKRISLDDTAFVYKIPRNAKSVKCEQNLCN